jgi:hypothetical protein
MLNCECYALSWSSLSVTLQCAIDPLYFRKIHQLLDLTAKPIPVSHTMDIAISQHGSQFQLIASELNKNMHFTRVDDLIVNAVNLISTFFWMRSPHNILHGGAFVVDHEAVIFSGMPHAGKSTLALAAWLAGYPLINDDLLTYDMTAGTIASFPKPLKPRQPSLNIPELISQKAEASQLAIGHFVHDIGLIIGKSARDMIGYHESIPVRAFYYIERGNHTQVNRLSKLQALTIVLSQVMPNRACLKITKLIEKLAIKNALFHLVIGEHDQTRALEIMTDQCSDLATI